MYRSINNGELRKNHVGQHVKLVGWVSKKRNLGSLVFIDLRDRSGIVQLAIKSDEINIPEIRSEYVISVEGVVSLKENPNKNLPTGEVEVLVSSLTLLNSAKTTPLIIADKTDALEDVRLKYRYLDLRRPIMQEKLITRAKIMRVARNYLDDNGFIEIETPILTKSTPGGARDYLVPSRIHRGSFYALPQSPQIYKQLLMIGGMERYYQIARCFRDEDLRADRQPDFTQIDIETSFLEMDELLAYMEGLLSKVFKEVVNVDLTLPLKRLSYEEAINTYGSDKPDARFKMTIKDLDVLTSSTFESFANNKYIRAIVAHNAANKVSRKQLDELNLISRKYNMPFVTYLKYNNDEFSGSLASKISQNDKDIIKNNLDLVEDDLVIIGFSNSKKDVLFGLGAIRLYFAKMLDLINKDDNSLLWVDRFPLFSYDEKTKKYVSEHHAFTRPLDEHLELLNTEPSKVLSQAFDIVINGYEAGGGSMRIFDQELQQKIFEVTGMSEEEISSTFGFFIEALKYGTPPHGGLAFGLDRLAMILGGTDNIRDVIAFPKNLSAVCPMSEEPGEVAPYQLEELHIKIVEENDK